jgi:hypothetical protein
MVKQEVIAIIPIATARPRPRVVEQFRAVFIRWEELAKKYMKRDVAKTLGVLETTLHFKSFARLTWRRKNFRLSEAPSFTAAHTYNCKDSSNTDTACKAVASVGTMSGLR